MTAREYCITRPATAYYSGFSGIEIHGIEYGIDDHVYCVSGAWGAPSKYSYHRLKIYYNRDGSAFFKLHGVRIPFNECIRMGALV